MAFRRRRKARPNWFPPLGTAFAIGEDTTTIGGVTFQISVDAGGALQFIEFPLTFDFGQEQRLATSPAESTLADLMSSAWRLRRIVGNVYAAFTPQNANVNDPTQTAVPACLFGVGFMVRNIDATGGVPGTNVDVLNQDDYTDPWIWRRVWLLGQGATPTRYVDSIGAFRPNNIPATAIVGGLFGSAAQNYPFTNFPSTNVDYGTAVGGPYVDAHTNRIIGPEQRLFIHFATKALSIQPQGYTGDGIVTGCWDLRYLGNLQRASNRRNASR